MKQPRYAKKKLENQAIRRMVGCLVKVAIILVMKNYFYSFNNEIRKQKKGGAIGNTLTEKIGKLLLKRFDKKYKSLLRKLKVEVDLYDRYVDDVTEAMVALDPWVRFDLEKIKMVKIKELEESDKNVDAAKRTMNELTKVASTVYESVQFTNDCPAKHPTGNMPVFDLQLYVGEDGHI